MTAPRWAGTLASRGETALMSTYARYPLELAAGEGCWLIDSAGRRYLDFTAGIAVNVLGHGHRAVVEAIRDASAGLLHVSNLYWTEPMIRLAERLAAAARMDKVFFCNSGAEAVEAALKLARRARPGRSRLVCFERSFHGRTLGALTVTAQHRYQEPFRPLLPDAVTLPFGDFEAPDEVVDESVSAVIVEPVQGEGGVRAAPAGWLAHLRSSCDRAGAVLIFDEVQAGIGRTGTFFACEQDGVLPDILVAAKALAAGLPMGAMLARGSVAGAFQPGDHGSTFGGGPLVAGVANAVLDEVLREGFLAEVESKGGFLRAALGRLAERSPRVAAVRGRGLMLGLVLASESAGDLVEAARGRGLLLCPAGADVVRLVPPLIVSEAELEEGVAMLEAALGDLGDENG